MLRDFKELGRLGTSVVFIVFFVRLYDLRDRCNLYFFGLDLHRW